MAEATSMFSSFCLMLWIVTVSGEKPYEHTCAMSSYPVRTAQRQRICGRTLTERLINQCGNSGMTVNGKKRSFRGFDSGGNKPEIDSLMTADDIFQSQSQANSFFKLTSKRQQQARQRPRGGGMISGIVCECCFNRCSLSELDEYCGDGKRRRKRTTRERLGGLPADFDVDEFYDEVEKVIDEEADAPPPTIEELLNDPIIQQLEYQKEKNALGSNSKRMSDEDLQMDQLVNRDEYLQVKDYLRSRLSRLLEEAKTGSADTNDEHGPYSNNHNKNFYHRSELERLWQLLEEDL